MLLKPVINCKVLLAERESSNARTSVRYVFFQDFLSHGLLNMCLRLFIQQIQRVKLKNDASEILLVLKSSQTSIFAGFQHCTNIELPRKHENV